MNTITCDFCDTIFNPKVDDPDQRCPKCGSVHDHPQSGMASLSDKTEMAFNDTHEKTMMESIPVSPMEDSSKEESAEEVFFNQSTRIAPPPPPGPKLRIHLNWREYLPTLIVCGVFLTWILFDKVIRPHPFEDSVTAAIEALNQGDPNTALREADRAVQIHPKSKLAQGLYDMAEKQIKSGK